MTLSGTAFPAAFRATDLFARDAIVPSTALIFIGKTPFFLVVDIGFLRNQQALNLVGALTDLRHLRITRYTLDRIILEIALATMQLYELIETAIAALLQVPWPAIHSDRRPDTSASSNPLPDTASNGSFDFQCYVPDHDPYRLKPRNRLIELTLLLGLLNASSSAAVIVSLGCGPCAYQSDPPCRPVRPHAPRISPCRQGDGTSTCGVLEPYCAFPSRTHPLVIMRDTAAEMRANSFVTITCANLRRIEPGGT